MMRFRQALPHARFGAILGGLALWCATALVGLGRDPAPAEQEAGPLTNSQQVIRLSAAEAGRALPVRLTGVVLLVSFQDNAVVVQDAAGAIYIEVSSPPLAQLHRGNQVRVEGTTHPGRFAPVIKPGHCTVIGTAPIPPAPRVAFTQLINGAYDGQWVEVTGIARTVSALPKAPEDALVELVSDEQRLPVRFYQLRPEVAQSWVDSLITAEGICFHFYNKKGQLFDAQLAVPEGQAAVVQAPPAPHPYALPVRPLRSLLRYEPEGWDPHRVHLRGTVTYVKPGYYFYLQEGENGLQVHTRQKETPPVGELVEVVGFTGRGTYGPMLEDAEFHQTGIQEVITPRPVDRRSALESDGALIEIEGQLVNTFPGPEEAVLLVQVAQSLVTARLDSTTSTRPPPTLENGSIVALTGVCRAVMGSPARSQWKWAPQSFELLLRDSADVKIVTPAPYWSSARALRAALVVLALAAGAMAFFFLRSRARLREQRQNRLSAEGQFAAVFRERNRVAREIHDTLAQGLTGISVQIEMAKERLATPSAALDHLEIARKLVRGSLNEARRSVWGMRPQICENQDLCAALREIAHQLTAGTEITVTVECIPAGFRVPPTFESDLLRVGQEAMTNAVKYAQARHLWVELRGGASAVELRVADDGRGGATLAASQPAGAGLGLTGMRERIQNLNGQFLLADRVGGGTELRLSIPLSSG